MIDINLLPWRFYAYQKKQQLLFYMLLASVGISVITFFILNYSLQEKIKAETVIINTLRMRLVRIEAQSKGVKKEKQQIFQFGCAQKLLTQVDTHQVSLLDLLHRISAMASPNVYLLGVKYNNSVTIFKGLARSSAALSSALSRVSSSYVQPPQMLEIKNDPVLKQLSFQFQLNQRHPFLLEKDSLRAISE